MSKNPSTFLTPGCTIIAEIAQAHDGSLGMAHSFIDAAADCGVDGVKFQTHIASAESTRREPWRVRFSPQDESRYDYWQRMEFTEEQWLGLRKHAHQRNILFISSPFSNEAVDLLVRVGVDAWKIASGEINQGLLFERILDEDEPIILSSGMSRWSELDDVVDRLKVRRKQAAILQCTSMYPTPPEMVGLNLLETMKKRYGIPVGLSDHSGVSYSAFAAATLGIEVLEVHFTLSRKMFGPDGVVSLEPDEMVRTVEGVRFIERMIANPVSKDLAAEQLEGMRQLFTKSVVAAHNLSSGHCLTMDDLALKKPGTGIPAKNLGQIVGRVLVRDLEKDEAFSEEDLRGGP